MANAAHMPVLEIRTYRLKPGMRESFHRLLNDEILSLLVDTGIRVVRFGPSLHDDNSYLLVRAFPSLADRTEQEDRFYGSREWLDRYDERVMAMIDTWNTVVIDVDRSAATALSGPL